MPYDGDDVLRLLILAILAKADRPMTAEQVADGLAQRLAALAGVPPFPERGH